MWVTLLLLALGQARPAAPTAVRLFSPPTGYAIVQYVTPYPVLFHYTPPPDTGIVSDTRSLAAFGGGQYLVWNILGHVRIVVTVDSGPNALVSGVFFGPQRTGTQAVTFVGVNTTAQGAWKGVYGSAGYSVAGDAVSVPVGTTLTLGAPTYTWEPSSTDVRSVQKPTATDRIMAAWDGAAFTIDLNVTGAPREVAIYAADYDAGGRKQTFTLLTDGPPAPIDSWGLGGWEVASFDGTTLVQSRAFDVFPNQDEFGQAVFGVPLELFPDTDRAYTVAVRYWKWTVVALDKPRVVTYLAWNPAPQKVIRRSDGSVEAR